MNWAEAEQLVEVFRQQAAAERYRKEIALADDRRDDDRKRDKLRERKEKEELERFEQLIEATDAQIAAMHETLDNYDTATVRALMENQKALDDVRHRIEATEAAAHHLPDGRVVFKTADGKRVFDRDGVQLSQDDVHPDAIPDSAPQWETFKGLKNTEHGLLQDREKLHAFQQRLDDTREAVDKGHMSADALAKLDADLKKAMPDTVKAHLPEASAGRAPPDTQNGPTATTKRPTVVPAPAGP